MRFVENLGELDMISEQIQNKSPIENGWFVEPKFSSNDDISAYEKKLLVMRSSSEYNQSHYSPSIKLSISLTRGASGISSVCII